MRARDIMTRGVVTIADTATIYEAAELMVSTRVSGLPVLNSGGALVGMISEADLIGQGGSGDTERTDALLHRIASDISEAAAFVKAHSNLVRDVMAKGVVTITEATELPEIAQLMLRRRVKRLPVMRGSQVVGVVSRINLVQALLAQGGARPAERQDVGASAGAVERPPAASARSSDEELEEAVGEAIRQHRWSSARVDVTVLNGNAHLWGVVADPAIRQAYLIAIEKIPGIRDIVDHTHVIPPHFVGR